MPSKRIVNFKTKSGETWVKRPNLIEKCMQKFRTQRQQHINRLRKCNIEIVASELLDEISDSDTASIDDKCSDRSLRTEMCIVGEDTASSFDDETLDKDSYENIMLALMDAIELELLSLSNENLANEHLTYNFGFGDAGVPEIDEGDSLLCPVCRYIVDTYRIISSNKLSLIWFTVSTGYSMRMSIPLE